MTGTLGPVKRRHQGGNVLIHVLGLLWLAGVAFVFVPTCGRTGCLWGTSTRVEADIMTLTQSIRLYQLEFFCYPTGWENLMEMEDGSEPYFEDRPIDPWGRPYLYQLDVMPSTFTISSFGKDGIAGGDGENSDYSRVTPFEQTEND